MIRIAVITAALAVAACAAEPTIEAQPLVTFSNQYASSGTCPQGKRVAISDHRPQGGAIEIACK